MTRIYLDYNASTPVDLSVANAMRAAIDDSYGNPSSAHWAGESAKHLLDKGREQVASLLGCSSHEIVFTAGGSESNNLAIKGLYFAQENPPAHVITSAVEHPSIIEPCRFLERLGARVTCLPVDSTGRVNPADLERAITPDTILISVMHASNEVGTIQPIEECARIARSRGVPFHTDAAQSAGKIRTRVDELGVDLLSIVGHKMYAPKGVGALYVRSGIKLESLIHGAGHEGGRRAGTESAMLAAALGAACALAEDLSWTRHARELRDRMWTALRQRLGDRIVLNGHAEYRLPNTLSVSVLGCVGADVLAALEGVAASTGSACHSGRGELSPVLRAMGVRESVGKGAIRFSLGRGTTREEIETTIDRMAETLRQF
jgi:cysteine desulfurase